MQNIVAISTLLRDDEMLCNKIQRADSDFNNVLQNEIDSIRSQITFANEIINTYQSTLAVMLADKVQQSYIPKYEQMVNSEMQKLKMLEKRYFELNAVKTVDALQNWYLADLRSIRNNLKKQLSI